MRANGSIARQKAGAGARHGQQHRKPSEIMGGCEEGARAGGGGARRGRRAPPSTSRGYFASRNKLAAETFEPATQAEAGHRAQGARGRTGHHRVGAIAGHKAKGTSSCACCHLSNVVFEPLSPMRTTNLWGRFDPVVLSSVLPARSTRTEWENCTALCV